MEIFSQLVQFIKEVFSWWFTVTPWEQAVFIRLGKKVKVLKNGFYFKIPFIDQVYVQSIRLRTVDLPIQTVTSKDDKSVTIKPIICYSIVNIYKLYNSISQPDLTLTGIVLAEIAEYIRKTDSCDLDFNVLEQKVLDKLNKVDYGLGDLSIKITSLALVKTFRLIQDQSWAYEGLDMEKQKK